MKKDNTIKLTLLDFAILCLIQNQPLTGYRIRKMFEETALGSYSSSPGTIYPALKRLEKFELIEKITQENTSKMHFKITLKGIFNLKKWFLKPIEKEDVEKKVPELLLRFGFMETLIEKKDRVHFLHSFKDLLVNYIANLERYYQKESNNMPLHGKLAFQYGIDSNITTLEWCERSIEQLKSN